MGSSETKFLAYRAAYYGTFVMGTAPFTWLHTRRAGLPAWLVAFAMTTTLSTPLWTFRVA